MFGDFLFLLICTPPRTNKTKSVPFSGIHMDWSTNNRVTARCNRVAIDFAAVDRRIVFLFATSCALYLVCVHVARTQIVPGDQNHTCSPRITYSLERSLP